MITVVVILLMFGVMSLKDSNHTFNIFRDVLIVVLFMLALVSLQARAEEPWELALKATTLKLSNGTASLVQGKSGKKYLLTNWHVCFQESYPNKILGINQDGSQYVGVFVRGDVDKDLCAYIVHTDIKVLKVGKKLPLTSTMHTRGYPQGHLNFDNGIQTLNEVAWGYLMWFKNPSTCPRKPREVIKDYEVVYECAVDYHSYETTLYANPGSSGSPVVNDSGELIGVVSGYHPSFVFSALVVRLKDIQAFMKGL